MRDDGEVMEPHDSFVLKWKSRKRKPPGSLEIIPDVYSPELDNRRDIVVYLPTTYARTDATYPVIYMHDGQNLFDPTTSFAGEWGVDEAMSRAAKQGRRAIVVGIPNMGFDRIREYSPFVDYRNGGGLGDAYVDFILGTLKPLIDARYRTRPETAHTGIIGSSLGGLISLYAFFREPASFGFCGVMSPALWFADGAIFPLVEAAPYVRGRIYVDVGTREGATTLVNARRLSGVLIDKGYAPDRDLLYVEEDGAMHNESAWGRRLRTALPFLLGGEHEES